MVEPTLRMDVKQVPYERVAPGTGDGDMFNTSREFKTKVVYSEVKEVNPYRKEV